MTSILGRIFGGHVPPPPLPARGDIAYRRAMAESDDILAKMRECSQSTDAARAVMADIWAQSHNIPFMVTVFEATAEMKSGTDQKPTPK